MKILKKPATKTNTHSKKVDANLQQRLADKKKPAKKKVTQEDTDFHHERPFRED